MKFRDTPFPIQDFMLNDIKVIYIYKSSSTALMGHSRIIFNRRMSCLKGKSTKKSLFCLFAYQ